MTNIKLFHGDCFDILPKLIDDGIKVNMVFADLPYNETGFKWDKNLGNYKLLFEYLEKLLTDDGAMLFTGTFKHGMTLYNACPQLYKYEWVWVKDNGTNATLTGYQPFKNHEYIYVFGKGRCSYGKKTPMKYNPQMTKGEPYKGITGGSNYNGKGFIKPFYKENEGERHPLTTQYFKRDRGLHPTQKPVAMIEYLIKTYTDKGDTVLDCTMGSGSSGVACRNTGRNFIGVELDDEYYEISKKRIVTKQTKLL